VAQIKSAPKLSIMKVMESTLAVSFQPAELADNLEDADKLASFLIVLSIICAIFLILYVYYV